MKFKWAGNERKRLILMLELAVVLPAAALVILSALHLEKFKRDRAVEAAIQRDFSQVLVISEKQLNQKAYDLVDDAKAEFPGPGRACAATLDKILAAHPYVAHVFVYEPGSGLLFRSQPSRTNDPNLKLENEYLSKMFDGWFAMDFDELSKKIIKMGKKAETPYYIDVSYPSRGDKHLYQSTAMFVKKDEETGKIEMGGITFDADFLQNKFFPEAMNTLMSRNAAETRSELPPAVMMIHPKNDATPIAACNGWDGGSPEVERNLEGAFPGLTLAIKLRGTTLAALGEHFMQTSFVILGVLSFLLGAGIFMTYRNVSKEMALAKLKSDFVSNVSHELRTPLSLIRLYAETLEMGRLTSPDKYQEYYQIIRKESERLTALINNILDFSRIEAGRKEYDFRETDLRELVHNTLESYRYQIEQNGFSFVEKIENVPPMMVDREAMARSLLNLVNNALKYSQDRKYIGVNLYRDNGAVKLEVVDHGIGIPVPEQQKIFEKFYRVGDPLVHNTKGSGLGLSLVRHIISAHGGEVAVDSAPGQGSRFVITLPLEAKLGKVAVATN
ncbi:MAG TPA: HAMP domain-containing sensor histidine kinase [Terriglobales bacterium]|jgi:signal transduction histidine kinase